MNWAAQIKNILDNDGISEIWLYQDTMSINFDVIKYLMHLNKIGILKYVTRIDRLHIFSIKTHFLWKLILKQYM